MTLKALLFDLDGTLVDTDPFHFEAWRGAALEFGLELSHKVYEDHVAGIANEEAATSIFPRLTPKQRTLLIEEKEQRFHSAATMVKPIPGVSKILAWAKNEQIRIALVTNAPKTNVDFLLCTVGFDRLFEHRFLSEDVGVSKPDPGLHIAALAQLEVEAREAISFDDMPPGITAAILAGTRAVGIASTSNRRNSLLKAGAENVFKNFTVRELYVLLSKSRI